MHSILLFMLPIDASVAAWRCGFARVVLWWCCDGLGSTASTNANCLRGVPSVLQTASARDGLPRRHASTVAR